MVQALDEVEIEQPLRGALRGYFEQSSAYLVNHGVVDTPGSLTHPGLACRWELQRRLDRAVAAVRAGDAGVAVEVAESCDRTVLPGLLALMIESGQPILLDYVREKITRDPSLTQERYAGRTLLHAASAAGSLSMVELFLRLGADPNAGDGGGHTPLYSVGNECVTAGGADVVRALVRAGAKVDARDGAKHCTALHMAARRGNAEVAEALLDCGADIESRDSLGDTPLRRSVNCGKSAVAALLLARGADVHSRGSKGLTPLLAARSGAMSRLLR
jgi:hypothetical protein